MAKTAQPITVIAPGDALAGQMLIKTNDPGLVADGKNIIQGPSGDFYYNAGGKTVETSKAEIRAMTNPNENLIYQSHENGIVQHWKYNPADQTGADNTGTILKTADNKILKDTSIGNGYVNVLQFGADPTGVADSTAAFQAALALMGTIAQHTIIQRVVIPTGIFLISQPLNPGFGIIEGFARVMTATSEGARIHYTGTGSCFSVNTSRITIRNLTVYTSVGDAGYKTAHAVEINSCNSGTLENIHGDNMDNVIFVNPGAEGIEYLNILRPSTQGSNCCVKVTQGASYANAIYIDSPYAFGCLTGVICDGGTGNILEFKGTEVGGNTNVNVELKSGTWVVKGPIWSEVTPIGIHVTGGQHFIEGDVLSTTHIVEEGGEIIYTTPQLYVNPQRKALNGRDLKFWWSFDEQSGDKAYSRFLDRVMALDTNFFTWSAMDGQFQTAIAGAGTINSKMGSCTDVGDIDLTKDWTVIILAKNNRGNTTAYNQLVFVNNTDAKPFYFNVSNDNFVVNESGQLWNPGTFPSNTYADVLDWAVMSYTAATGMLTAYTQSGVPVGTHAYTMLAKYASLSEVYIFNNQVLDEVIFYNRVLSAKEICSITHLGYLPENSRIPAARPELGASEVFNGDGNTVIFHVDYDFGFTPDMIQIVPQSKDANLARLRATSITSAGFDVVVDEATPPEGSGNVSFKWTAKKIS